MTLAPEAWGRLIEDERTQDLVVPFIGFFEFDDPEFEPADDIAERLDQAATAIPRAILVLRKLAKFRGADGFAANKGSGFGKDRAQCVVSVWLGHQGQALLWLDAACFPVHDRPPAVPVPDPLFSRCQQGRGLTSSG